MGQKNFVVRNRVEAALDHSLSPYTSEDLKSEIVEAPGVVSKKHSS